MTPTSSDVDPHPASSRVTLKFHFPYRPSKLLCSALIFWTVLCIISEAILPFLDVIFTITIYGPTVYLAVRFIKDTSRGTDEPTDSDKMGKTAAILSVLWILVIPTHVYIKWIEPKYSEVFLIPVLPASQVILMMVYIAVHYALEKRARRFPELAVASTQEEASSSTMDAESQPLLASNPQFGIYRPSKTLLVVSILVAVGSWATETLCLTWRSPHRSFAVFLWFLLIWIYVPLIQLQLYTLKRAFRRCAPTLEEEGGIGNYWMDLAAIFVGTKPLVILYTLASTQYGSFLYVPGAIQACLVIYMAVRYAWSFSKVIPRYAQAISLHEEASDDPISVAVAVSEPAQAHDAAAASSSTHAST